MKYLIIYAHPQTGCFCAEILKQVEQRLKKHKDSYRVLDLYRMKYDPRLKEQEHYTSGGKAISPDNQKMQQHIKEADRLIFIYPIWWGSMPAILKGWFDRILTPGFAFKYQGVIPIGLLNKKAIVFMTSGGPGLYYFLTGFRNHKVIKNDILRFCGIKSKIVQIYSAQQLTSGKKEEIRSKVNKYI